MKKNNYVIDAIIDGQKKMFEVKSDAAHLSRNAVEMANRIFNVQDSIQLISKMKYK